MSWGNDKEHSLRVDEYGNLDIIHAADCKTEKISAPPFDEWEEYTCPVGRHVSWYGFDDLTDESGNNIPFNFDTRQTSIQSGDYPITLEWFTPESMFEDAEIAFHYDPRNRVDTPNQNEEDHSALSEVDSQPLPSSSSAEEV